MPKLAWIAVFFSLSAFAQLRCVDKLVPLARPSGVHQLMATEWQPQNAGTLTETDALRATSFLVHGKLLCPESEIQIDRLVTCAVIDPNSPQHVSCLLRTNLGYFSLTQDWGKNANFVFTKNPPHTDN